MRGYTLVELIMVMVLIAIMSAIVAPRLAEQVHSWDLEMESRKVLAKLRELQQRSITEGEDFGIRFQADAECYDIGPFVSDVLSFVEETICLDNGIYLNKVMGQSSPYKIYFDYLGAPQEAIDLYIRRTPAQEQCVRVRNTGQSYLVDN